jgi:hypothetical protein
MDGQPLNKEDKNQSDQVPLDPRWCLPSRLEDNPMVWILQVDGFMVDIRSMPRELQEAAYQKGLIPYIPADRKNQQ